MARADALYVFDVGGGSVIWALLTCGKAAVGGNGARVNWVVHVPVRVEDGQTALTIGLLDYVAVRGWRADKDPYCQVATGRANVFTVRNFAVHLAKQRSLHSIEPL